MKRYRLTMIAALASMTMPSMAQTYKDVNASAHERAVSIVAEMTLDEKVSLMRHESPAIPRLGIKQCCRVDHLQMMVGILLLWLSYIICFGYVIRPICLECESSCMA